MLLQSVLDHTPINIPLCAASSAWQLQPSTGLVLAHNDMFMGITSFVKAGVVYQMNRKFVSFQL